MKWGEWVKNALVTTWGGAVGCIFTVTCPAALLELAGWPWAVLYFAVAGTIAGYVGHLVPAVVAAWTFAFWMTQRSMEVTWAMFAVVATTVASSLVLGAYIAARIKPEASVTQ